MSANAGDRGQGRYFPFSTRSRRVGNVAAKLSRRSFLRIAAWLPTVLMGMAKATTGRKEFVKADQIEVVHTRVFAASQDGGNPCPVIPSGDNLTDRQMQRLARKFGFDTAFILSPRTKNADIRLRYFVPDHEMGVSGHATIAAITIALFENRLKGGRMRVETMTGIFEVESIRGEDGILVTLAQNKPVFGPTVAPDLVARALTIDPKRIALAGSPIQSVSVSRAKLVIPLEDSNVLNSLTPDYEALWKLCDQFQVTGFYPFTRQTDKPNAQVEARQFPQRAGFPEDAATGVAAAALGAYLATYDYKCQTGRYEFRVAQGYAMQAPSLIEACIECAEGKVTRTAIRGRAQVLDREWVDA